MWRLANDSDAEWQTITADDIAEAPEGGLTVTSVEESGIEYRRPVDAVPCEEHERLRQRLAEAESLLGEAMRGGQQLYAEVGELRSQPRLQPVTLEAMAAIKQRDFSRVLFVTPFRDADGKQLVSHNVLHWYYNQQAWYEEDDYPAEDTESSHDWFIDLTTIPEATV
jgi:hypothetical protein